MKKLAILAALAMCATGAYAQGKVTFLNNLTGSVKAPVYMPDVNTPSVRFSGDAANGNPVGTTVYTGGLVDGGTTLKYTAQLYWAPGTITDPLSSSLTPLLPTTTVRNGSAVGFINNVDVPIATTANTVVSLQMRVWDNVGGTITSWDAATIRGYSDIFASNPLAGAGTGDPSVSNTTGIRSFSLTTSVPEPTTMALWALGAGSLLLIRRRK